jgi:hypothetical protein
MNTQLVESLIQVISSLPAEEQNLLGKRLSGCQPAMSQKQIQFDLAEDIMQPLIATGRIIPPSHFQDIASMSQTELREMTSNMKISGKPLSETVIEDRGEW